MRGRPGLVIPRSGYTPPPCRPTSGKHCAQRAGFHSQALADPQWPRTSINLPRLYSTLSAVELFSAPAPVHKFRQGKLALSRLFAGAVGIPALEVTVQQNHTTATSPVPHRSLLFPHLALADPSCLGGRTASLSSFWAAVFFFLIKLSCSESGNVCRYGLASFHLKYNIFTGKG